MTSRTIANGRAAPRRASSASFAWIRSWNSAKAPLSMNEAT